MRILKADQNLKRNCPMSKILKILLIIFGILVVANFSVLDFFFVKDRFIEKKTQEASESETVVGEQSKIATDSCGLSCQQEISQKIDEELSRLPSPAGQSSFSPSAPTKTPTQPNGKPKVVYIPLAADGTVASASWTNVVPSEFYFDQTNYPGVKEVRFEVNLLSLNNDLAFVRIYDATNKRAVDFSDLQTTSSTFTRIESSPLVIWRGNNKYTIQLRSVNGTQAQLKDARLKILY